MARLGVTASPVFSRDSPAQLFASQKTDGRDNLTHPPPFTSIQPKQGGRTALHAAAISGSRECVDFLLARGWEDTASDFTGMQPLHWACFFGRTGCVEALLEREEVDPLIDSEARPCSVSAPTLYLGFPVSITPDSSFLP